MSEIPPLFDVLWFRIVVGLIVGSTLGSFVTMLSYRLPRHMSITKLPSHCPSCKARLEHSELIPVVSWLMAHGKCRHCGTAISKRYIWTEIVTAIASAVTFVLIGFQLWLFAALAGIVAVITLVTIQLQR